MLLCRRRGEKRVEAVLSFRAITPDCKHHDCVLVFQPVIPAILKPESSVTIYYGFPGQTCLPAGGLAADKFSPYTQTLNSSIHPKAICCSKLFYDIIMLAFMTVCCYYLIVPNEQYTIQELCEHTGYSRRTVRYYVEIGLLDPPAGRGRGGFYNDSHLNRLKQVRTLQEKGMNLTTIVGHLKGAMEEEAAFARDVWVKYEIIPGVEISVRRDVEIEKGSKIFEMIRVVKSIAKEK